MRAISAHLRVRRVASHVPAKAHHYAFAKVPTVIQVTAEGPFDINWIDPKDEPTKSQ